LNSHATSTLCLILVGVIWFRSDPDGTLAPVKANDTPVHMIQ
jgi:hypothetical protein